MAGKGKILVVDDDRLVLATLSHGLSQAGYQVIDADNGDDAILLAREHRPDLALLDIRMEGKSGFDVAAYLRESLQTPFMFLSAFCDDDTVAQVRELGAITYLVKPLDIHQIVPAIEAAFGHLLAHGSKSARKAFAARFEGHVVDDPALSQVVSIAVGVLMHRYSITRAVALDRLYRLAASQGHSPEDEARKLVEAVELLAMPSMASERQL